MTILSLTHLYKSYNSGAIPVLHDLSLRVESGELVALLGASGSGKTTLLRVIAGLLTPDSGDIHFDDQSMLRIPPEKRGAAIVFQEHQLFPFMTAAENIAFGLKIKRLKRDEIRRRVQEALEWVKLPDLGSRYPHQLSGGQKQRIALTRALVIQPRLLLLDEPLSNLDPALRDDLRREILRLQKTFGITAVFVTHDQAEAVAVADRIALLLNGQIAQIGAARDFYERPATLEIARFFGTANVLPACKKGEIIETSCGILHSGASLLPDSDVLALIRPEAVQIGANGANTLQGIVQSWSYQGDSSRGVIQVGNTALEMHGSPYEGYQPGDMITFHIKHIWLVPKGDHP